MAHARTLLLLLLAALVWLPSVHVFYAVDAESRRALGASLAGRLAAAPLPAVSGMRAVNPEWDFMRRTFAVLALANRALAYPEERDRDLEVIDAVVDATIGESRAHGDEHFMLAYAKRGPFADPEAKSVFIDGEILMMVAARELVAPRGDARVRDDARLRADRIEGALRRSPSLSGESYPNECWTFCNTTALAALTLLDRVERADTHAPLARDWVAHAKAHLVDARTGILVSSYTWDGRVLDGPEGSSIWMSAQNLLLVDEAFARDQYARARRELGASALGFGWAREWPADVPERPDVDSGPIVPWIHASAGSSGLAVLGASAFGDEEWLGQLLASVELTGFRDAKTNRFRASNEVGDAVLAYALAFGPLVEKAKRPVEPPAARSWTGGVR